MKKRNAGFMETLYYSAFESGHNTGQSDWLVSIDGTVSEGALREALRQLCVVHPALRSEFKKHPLPPWHLRLVSHDSTYPRRREPPIEFKVLDVPTSHFDELKDEAFRRCMNSPLDLTRGYAWRLLALTNGEKTSLICSAHHAIMDALSMVLFFRDLLAMLEPSGAARAQEKPILPPIEMMLTKKTPFLKALARELARSRPPKSKLLSVPHLASEPSQKETHGTIVRPVDASGLGRIKQSCASNGVTLNSLMASCLLKAVHDEFAGPGRNADFLQIDSAVLLKNRVEERYRSEIKESIGVFVTGVQTFCSVSHETSILDIAKEYEDKLHKAIRDDASRPCTFSSNYFTRLLLSNMSKARGCFDRGVAISNIGLQDQYFSGLKLKAKESHGCTNTRPGTLILLVAGALADKLLLQFNYSETLLDARRALSTADRCCEYFLKTLSLGPAGPHPSARVR